MSIDTKEITEFDYVHVRGSQGCIVTKGIIVAIDKGKAIIKADGQHVTTLVSMSNVSVPDYSRRRYIVEGKSFDTEEGAVAYRSKLTFAELYENDSGVGYGMKVANFILMNRDLTKFLLNSNNMEVGDTNDK